MKMKRPKVGDRIRHEQIELDRTVEGVVTCVLSAQFMYKTDLGYLQYCLFKEDWEIVEDEKET